MWQGSICKGALIWMPRLSQITSELAYRCWGESMFIGVSTKIDQIWTIKFTITEDIMTMNIRVTSLWYFYRLEWILHLFAPRFPVTPTTITQTTHSRCCYCCMDYGNTSITLNCNQKIFFNGDKISVNGTIDNSKGKKINWFCCFIAKAKINKGFFRGTCSERYSNEVEDAQTESTHPKRRKKVVQFYKYYSIRYCGGYCNRKGGCSVLHSDTQNLLWMLCK